MLRQAEDFYEESKDIHYIIKNTVNRLNQTVRITLDDIIFISIYLSI